MPTYEYRCSDCGNTFDIVQRIGDDTLTVCERCGGKLRKVFHPAGIVFKGSGFYATDSRSKSKSASQESGEKKSDDKTDKKEKTETKATESNKQSSGSEKKTS
jgi:putative FmdB family regulatory protein